MNIRNNESSTSIFKQAFELTRKSQEEFGELIGKNQSQVSKYLRGQIAPSAESIIHCMNIIHREGLATEHCPATAELLLKIQKLKGSEYATLRKALHTMIDAVMNNSNSKSIRESEETSTPSFQ